MIIIILIPSHMESGFGDLNLIENKSGVQAFAFLMKRDNLQLLVQVLMGQTICTSDFWILLQLGNSGQVFIPRDTRTISHSCVIAISNMAGIRGPNPLCDYHRMFRVQAACPQFSSNGFPPLISKTTDLTPIPDGALVVL